MKREKKREIWTRQMAIPGFGEEGQKRLEESRVAVLGLGGVGGPASLYLAAAGVGNLVLVDGDAVEASNLNRQILFAFSDLGRPKAHVAAERLLSLNPELKVGTVEKKIDERDLEPLLKGCNFVLDCFDRNADRLAVNRECVRLGIPAVHGFAQDFSGEVFTVLPGKSACLACALDEGFPEMEISPVIGVATGMIGTAMAAMAVLSLTGIGDPAAGKRLIYDLAFPEVMKIPVEKKPLCPACGK
ncbi:MAG TPA: HesA/MoeB/ThiF family protein [Methanotrichaceae archaeon]|nr:HesA/MoeB/ThiF family protein [Methanotrichaceae archaeon]